MRKHLYIATCAYQGLCSDYIMSLLGTVPLLQARGWQVEWKLLEGCCYVHTARNKLVKWFLTSEAEYMCFIDADVGWNGAEFVEMMERDVEIIGAAAPFRTGEDSGFPVGYVENERGEPFGDIETGLIESSVLPTAMMRIQRNVFIEMAKENMAPLRLEFDRRTAEEVFRFLSYFEFEVDENLHIEFGEDVTFCRKARKIGKKLWVEPNMTMRHWGQSHREANLLKVLLKKQEERAAVVGNVSSAA